MSQQLDRVNNDPTWLRERIDEADAEISRLRAALRERDRRIFDLEDQVKALESRAGRVVVDSAPQTYQGRPVLTPAQAAVRTWVSRSTVNRYLTSGHWDGVQVPGSNRWLVFADQPLTQKHKKK